MTLTTVELNELKGLHFAISHAECFGSRDVLREDQLFRKASDSQLLSICAVHYQEEL